MVFRLGTILFGSILSRSAAMSPSQTHIAIVTLVQVWHAEGPGGSQLCGAGPQSCLCVNGSI
jgi:hypothetical protein